MATGKRSKCMQCNQHKLNKYMVGGVAGICNHCTNTKQHEKHKPVFKNGLFYKYGTNLVVRINPYNL